MKRTRLAWAIASIATALMIVSLVVAVFVAASKSSQIRDTQQTNTQTIDSSAEVLEIIKGCTTPGAECYERGKQQTAGAVADINRVVILAAACSSGLPSGLSVQTRQARIQTCVINRLAQK